MKGVGLARRGADLPSGGPQHPPRPTMTRTGEHTWGFCWGFILGKLSWFLNFCVGNYIRISGERGAESQEAPLLQGGCGLAQIPHIVCDWSLPSPTAHSCFSTAQLMTCTQARRGSSRGRATGGSQVSTCLYLFSLPGLSDASRIPPHRLPERGCTRCPRGGTGMGGKS